MIACILIILGIALLIGGKVQTALLVLILAGVVDVSVGIGALRQTLRCR